MPNRFESKIKVTGDVKDIQKKLDQVNAKLEDVGEQSEKQATRSNIAFSKLGFGITAIVGTIGLAAKKALDAYGRQEIAEKRLEQVIKATGGAAGLTADELKRMASELQKVTTFGDEALIEVEGLFLTFTNIGKEALPDALEAAADMSVMFGQDLKQSAIQLGTALNDPIEGVGRLRRIGISFTEEQKESIKRFMEQNDIMSAQKVILDELANEFGGVARGEAQTMTGSIQQMKNAVGDAAEAIGEVLSPVIISAANTFKSAAEWTKEFITELENLVKYGNVVGEIEKDNVEKLEKRIQATKDLINDLIIQKIAMGYLTKEEEELLQTSQNMLIVDERKLETLKAINQALGEQSEKTNTLTTDIQNAIPPFFGYQEGLAAIQIASKNVGTQLSEAFSLEKATAIVKRWDDVFNQLSNTVESFYAYGSQLRENDMNEEIRKVQESTKTEEEKQAEIANIKEYYRQKDIDARAMMKPVKLAQAISNGALAVLKAYSAAPPPFNFALAAMVGAATAAEIATIKAQKFGEGAILKQPIFSPLLKGGAVAGEAGPEAVIPLTGDNAITRIEKKLDGLTDQRGDINVNVQVYGDFIGTEENADRLAEILTERARLGFNLLVTKDL